MLQKPAFRRHYQIASFPGEGALLLCENENQSVLFQGKIYADLFGLLNGKHSIIKIISALRGKYQARVIKQTILALEKKGYLIEGDESSSSPVIEFINALNPDSTLSIKKLANTKVTITCVGKCDKKVLQKKLLDYGVTVINTPSGSKVKDPQLDIVITDDYLHADLLKYNENALRNKRPWLLFRPNGLSCWIGPLFVPGVAGCYQCLRKRLESNYCIKRFVMDKKGWKEPPLTAATSSPSTLDIAYSLAALEVVKYLIHPQKKQLQGKLFSFDMCHLKARTHTLLSDKHCPACGKLVKLARLPTSIKLRKHKIQNVAAGYFATSARQFIEKYSHLISPITGIVSTLKPFDKNHKNIYISACKRKLLNPALASIEEKMWNLCWGKGETAEHAKAGALSEALERYSGEFTGTEARITSSYKKLGKKSPHPDSYMLYSEKQYQQRNKQNLESENVNAVPLPFDENALIEWSPVWSLSHRRYAYFLTQYLYYQYPASRRYCYADSNGNAAADCLESAILQGFFELVERDCMAIWWYNRLRRPRVALESFNNPFIAEFKQRWAEENREIWVLDITNDLGVPAFVAVSRKKSQKENILFGSACHFDPAIALRRAFLELEQVLVMYKEPNNRPSEVKKWFKIATLKNQPYLKPDVKLQPVKQASFTYKPPHDLSEAVTRCVDLVKSKGLEMFVLEQTREETGLKVVKVIVPGLRQFWQRFAPGRLYDVPVKMGWLKKPLPENDLNPIPIFL